MDRMDFRIADTFTDSLARLTGSAWSSPGTACRYALPMLPDEVSDGSAWACRSSLEDVCLSCRSEYVLNGAVTTEAPSGASFVFPTPA